MSEITLEAAAISRGAALRSAGTMLRRVATTGAHIAAEKLRPTPPRLAADVPVSANHMTEEWLTAVLCRECPGAGVVSFTVPGGSSGTSTRDALRVVYNDVGTAAGLPTELFVKSTTTYAQRLILGLSGHIDGEVEFFNRVRPCLDIESPHGYHSAIDRRSWRSISVIEDIAATRGAVFLHSDTAFGRAEIEDVLSLLASMHGTMWEDPSVTAPTAWTHSPLEMLRTIKSSINMRKQSAFGALKRSSGVMPPSLLDRLDDAWEAFERVMVRATNGPQTFLHGDCHVGQTYRTREGRVGLTDWQVVLRGSWAFDVALSISSALAIEDRRAWERDLLEFYLERLAQAGGEPPELEQAFELYRGLVLYPYHSWTYTIGRRAYQPKMQPPHLCLPIVERTAQAIVDLDALNAAR